MMKLLTASQISRFYALYDDAHQPVGIAFQTPDGWACNVYRLRGKQFSQRTLGGLRARLCRLEDLYWNFNHKANQARFEQEVFAQLAFDLRLHVVLDYELERFTVTTYHGTELSWEESHGILEDLHRALPSWKLYPGTLKVVATIDHIKNHFRLDATSSLR